VSNQSALLRATPCQSSNGYSSHRIYLNTVTISGADVSLAVRTMPALGHNALQNCCLTFRLQKLIDQEKICQQRTNVN
jgi:hypothetical protein